MYYKGPALQKMILGLGGPPHIRGHEETMGFGRVVAPGDGDKWTDSRYNLKSETTELADWK